MSKPLDLEEGWSSVVIGIEKLKTIIEGTGDSSVRITQDDKWMLYTTVYNLCTQKGETENCTTLYNRYRETLEDYLSSTVLPSLRDKQTEFLLRDLVLRWSNHNIMLRWLFYFFNYLDRFHADRMKLPKLKDAGKICFRSLVYEELNGDFTAAVIKQIEREREGEKIDRALIKNVIDFYVNMEVGVNSENYYTKDFETAMVKDTSSYYSIKASTWIEHDSCPEYMIKAEECLKKEKDRVSHYLHSTSETKLIEKVQHELLTTVSSQLLGKENSGCRALLREDKVDDLSRMYRLFSKISGGLNPVALEFKKHVTDEGMALVKQAEDSKNKDDSFVRKLIELHEKYLKYVDDCFASNSIFHKALKEGFEVFCNKEVAGHSSAELLATFVDNTLKKGSAEKLSDEAIEETLDNVVRLLAYVSEKDLFAEFYRKKLARRLINGKSLNDEHDRSILMKMKQSYGGQYTSKMEGMLTDMTLARENQAPFRKYMEQKPDLKLIDVTVDVLTTGFWPSFKSSDVNLPIEMINCIESFREFYQTKTKHRKLTWIFSMGTCNVDARFKAKPIELIVSTYQAAVLMLFNSSDKLSYEEIVTQLNLQDDDVMRILHSLSCAKYKFLTKQPDTKTISKTDVFEFNAKFTDKMRRIKVPPPPVDDRKKVVEDVVQDRRYAVDAALVRIMKSRKVLGYQPLVVECVEMIGKMFKPDVKLIKKRIENLITQDYLERDSENDNIFKYVA